MEKFNKEKVINIVKDLPKVAIDGFAHLRGAITNKLNQHRESIEHESTDTERSNEMSNWEADIEVRTVSPNIVIKIVNVIIGILEKISGTRRSGKIVETDGYLSLNTKTQVLFFFLKSEEKTKLAKNRISGFQVSTVKTWFIFKTNIIEIYGSGLANLAYQVKVTYSELQEKAETWLK